MDSHGFRDVTKSHGSMEKCGCRTAPRHATPHTPHATQHRAAPRARRTTPHHATTPHDTTPRAAAPARRRPHRIPFTWICSKELRKRFAALVLRSRHSRWWQTSKRARHLHRTFAVLLRGLPSSDNHQVTSKQSSQDIKEWTSLVLWLTNP
jgi:hypothetical protein